MEDRIYEGNNLIQRLMGDLTPLYDLNKLIYAWRGEYGLVSTSELEYHVNYNWLMKAFKKVVELGYDIELGSYIGNTKRYWAAINLCLDVNTNDIKSFIEPIESDDPIDCLYRVIVEFAKHYNS